MGGGWCNYVYEATPFPNLPPVDPNAKVLAIGSYKDTGSRALRYGPHAYGYTAETCAKACPTFKYVALQNNGWCCCDNDLSHVTKYGPASCGLMGGGWCNYVYQNNDQPTGYLTIKELGAYKDKEDRAMRYGPKTGGYNYDTCQKACPGYKYFAIQYGS
jgi:hypothetical protein